jgi:hypothetical protein
MQEEGRRPASLTLPYAAKMNRMLTAMMLVIFVAGCTIGGDSKTDLEKDLYKGTQGVVLTFFDTPRSLFEGELLDYNIRIENKGPYKMTNARLVTSVEKGYAEFSDGNNVHVLDSIKLEGKTVYEPYDDFIITTIPIRFKELDGQSETHDSFIFTTFCYDYQGMLFADVCIDTDPYGLIKQGKACTTNSAISLGDGQGGPVAITKIESKMMLDDDVIRPQFKIFLNNRGRGSVIQHGSVDMVCNKEPLSRETYNTLGLEEIELSGRTLSSGAIECIPNTLVLKNEEDSLTCTVKKEFGFPKSAPSFMTPLNVRISYGYTESTSKEISINKILKY